jgi:hypothetical protein
MNYARFTDWLKDRENELVLDFGVPRDTAEALMRWVRNGGIAAEAEARNEDQFLLDFDEVGSENLAKRRGTSPQAIRKQRTRILKNRNRRLRA